MIRVIGLGSPFGDDRVGWELIDCLRGRLPGSIDLVKLDRPGAALINWLQGFDRVVLIDAVAAPGEPGRLIRIEPFALGRPGTGWSSHGLDLARTLELARALGSLPRRVDLYGIAIDPGDLAAGRRVARPAITQIAAQLVNEVLAG